MRKNLLHGLKFLGNVSNRFIPRAFVLFLCAALPFSMIPMAGCTPQQVAQFEQVLGQVAPAVATVLQIVALFSAKTDTSTLPAKISADVAGIEKLYSDYEAAAASAKGSIEAEVNAAFAVLQSDLSTVFALAQVSDKNTQAKLTAFVGLISSAVQIAEGFIVPAVPAASAVAPLKLNPSSLVDSWNKILVAKTGNAKVDSYTHSHGHLHLHSKFVRVISFGVAN
jgi:hypothetical protein